MRVQKPMRGRDGHHQRLPCLNCRDPDRLGVPHESTAAAQTSYMQTSHILNATSRRVHQNRRERRGAVQRQRCRDLGLVSRFLVYDLPFAKDIRLVNLVRPVLRFHLLDSHRD